MPSRLGLACALALIAAADGCAIFYNYGGYQGDTKGTGGQGGATSSSRGSTGGSANGGGGSSSGTAGGGGGGGIPSCAKDDQSEPYAPAWVLTFGNGKTTEVAGVNLTSSGVVTVAGTFKGSVEVGGKPIASTDDAMLLTQIDSVGQPLYAKVFGGDGPVQATALAVEDSGDAHVFGSFTSSVQLPAPGPNYQVPDSGSVYSFIALMQGMTGQFTSSQEIPCDTQSFGIPSCSVVIDDARVSTMGLAVGGEVLGRGYLDGPSHSNTNAEPTSMTLAGFAGMLTPELVGVTNTGTFSPDAVNPAVVESSGLLVYGGNATGTIQLSVCGSSASAQGEDIFLMKRMDASPLHAWLCPGVFQKSDNQQLDAIVALASGSIAIAGRTDGALSLGDSMDDDSTGPGIFVAVLDNTRTVVWKQKYPVTPAGRVHLEVSPVSGNLLLSGTFTGKLQTDLAQVKATKPAGFAAVVPGSGSTKFSWARALLPCPGESTTSSLVASWSSDSAIAIAGTVDGAAQIAGAKVGLTGAKRFFAARLDQSGN